MVVASPRSSDTTRPSCKRPFQHVADLRIKIVTSVVLIWCDESGPTLRRITLGGTLLFLVDSICFIVTRLASIQDIRGRPQDNHGLQDK
jgi:hypothetical protein